MQNGSKSSLLLPLAQHSGMKELHKQVRRSIGIVNHWVNACSSAEANTSLPPSIHLHHPSWTVTTLCLPFL